MYTIARPNDAGDYGYEPGVDLRVQHTQLDGRRADSAERAPHRGAISDAEFEDLKARTIAAS